MDRRPKTRKQRGIFVTLDDWLIVEGDPWDPLTSLGNFLLFLGKKMKLIHCEYKGK